MSTVTSIFKNPSIAEPWEGLGETIQPTMSLEEMVHKAGLNWKVVAQKIYSRSVVAPFPVEEMTDYRRICRDTDNRTYQIASDGYSPLQNSNLVGFFKEYLESAGMTIDTLGALDEGARVWALAKINGGFELPGKDKVNTRLLVANSHDGSLMFTTKFCSIRVVCANTFAMALREAGKTFKAKHSRRDQEKMIQDAKEALGLAKEEIQKYQQKAELLSQVHIDPKGQEILRYISALVDPQLLDKVIASTTPMGNGSILDNIVAHTVNKPTLLTESDFNRAGKGILDAIISSPGSDLASSKETLWGVFNGVTYWADHVRGDARTTQDSRLNNSWFGQISTVKERALDLAVDLAKVVDNTTYNRYMN